MKKEKRKNLTRYVGVQIHSENYKKQILLNKFQKHSNDFDSRKSSYLIIMVESYYSVF